MLVRELLARGRKKAWPSVSILSTSSTRNAERGRPGHEKKNRKERSSCGTGNGLVSPSRRGIWERIWMLDKVSCIGWCHFAFLSILHDRNGQGVEKDKENETYHLEEAAIQGHTDARYNLALNEVKNGRIGRAVKHLIIAANLGCDNSIQSLKRFYGAGLISKDDFAGALRAHYAAVETTKSPQREKAAKTDLAASGDDWSCFILLSVDCLRHITVISTSRRLVMMCVMLLRPWLQTCNVTLTLLRCHRNRSRGSTEGYTRSIRWRGSGDKKWMKQK